MCAALVLVLLTVGIPARALAASPIDLSSRDYAEKFLTWLEENRDERTALPYSHVGDARFERWTITYDAAVVALAYLASGRSDDARRILDVYIDTPRLWRLGGVVEAFIPGETVQVTDWSVRSGANIWLANAAVRCYQKTGSRRYLDLARRIMEMILGLQHGDKASPNDGGIALGPVGDPSYPDDQHIAHDPAKPLFSDIYATEVSLDAHVVFSLLYRVSGERRYQQAAAGCLEWVRRNGFNRDEQRFNRGFRDTTVATDVHSWAVSALGLEGLETFEKGLASRVTDFVEKNCMVEVDYDLPGRGTVRLRGVDFTDKDRAAAMGRPPLVSFEWTFQWINACQRLAGEHRRRGHAGAFKEYSRQKEQLLRQVLAAATRRGRGLAYPYATRPDAVIGHEYRTPSGGNLSAIGAAYALLVLQGVDPMVPEAGGFDDR